MAHVQLVRRTPSLFSGTFVYPLADWRARLGEWRRRMRSRRELAVLCDRCLRDIRVTRCDAELEVRKPFWRA